MLREFKTLLPYFKKYALYYLGGFFFLFITDGGQLVIPQILKLAIDTISKGQFNLDSVLIYALCIGGAALATAVARFWWRFFFHGVSFRIESELRDKLYAHLLTLSTTFYGQAKVGELMAHMTNDMEAVRRATGFSFVTLFDGIFMSITILAILFIQNTPVALLTFIPLPFVTLLMLLFGKWVGKYFKRVQEGYSRLTDMVQESLAGIRVVKAFVQEHPFLNRFVKCNNDYSRYNMALIRVDGLFNPFVGLLAALTIFFLLLFGGMAVIEGRLTIGELTAFFTYLQMLIWPMLGAGFTINLLQKGAASLGRINSILQKGPDISDLPGLEQLVNQLPSSSTTKMASLLSVTSVTDPPPAVARPATVSVVPEILIRDLSYTYPGTTPAVLSHLQLHIPAGQWLGILGRTGSGKSTLVKLFPRLLDPPPGTLFINNQDIRTLPLKELRSLVVMVPQDTFLFSASILENIALGRLGEVDVTELQQAVAIVTMDRDLAGFPQGWDTIVGERGITLSGGQKQRVALARALINQASLVILDDAFAAVDTETEDRILQGLARLLMNKTVILISHRISTLKRANSIIVLDKGQIIQQGTHKDLLQNKHGFYAEIYRAQQLEATLG